jgi:hypothetical protein
MVARRILKRHPVGRSTAVATMTTSAPRLMGAPVLRYPAALALDEHQARWTRRHRLLQSFT